MPFWMTASAQTFGANSSSDWPSSTPLDKNAESLDPLALTMYTNSMTLTLKHLNRCSRCSSKTKMKFKKMVHDFGRMKEGEKREFDFEFTNTGKEDLYIEDCKGSCGCTVPEWPKEAIKPGQTAAIKVKFDSTKKEKDQEKSVTITANTEPEITTVIKIKAYVEPSAAK